MSGVGIGWNLKQPDSMDLYVKEVLKHEQI